MKGDYYRYLAEVETGSSEEDKTSREGRKCDFLRTICLLLTAFYRQILNLYVARPFLQLWNYLGR